MPRRLLAGLLLLAACESPPAEAPTSALGPSEAPAALAVSNAYAPVSPAGGTTALFFTIDGGPEADTLVAVRTEASVRTEVHESFDDDGLRGMRPVDGVAVPAGGTVALAPGSFHAMLFETTRAIAPGDTVAATAVFARAGEVPVAAVVRSLDDLPAPE